MPPCFLITSKWCRVLCHGAIETQDPALNSWNMIQSFPCPHSCRHLGWALLQKSFIERLSNVGGQKAKIICRKWIFSQLCILIPRLLASLMTWRGWRIYPRMHLSAIVQWTSHYYCNWQSYFCNACQRQRTTQQKTAKYFRKMPRLKPKVSRCVPPSVGRWLVRGIAARARRSAAADSG